MPIAAVRINDPLPPLRPVSRRAVVCIAAPEVSRAERTARVWLPMSLGVDEYHSANPAATASRPAGVRTSTPVAVTLATAIAIDVSSVHSPGSKPNGPPPIIAIGVSGDG